MQYVLLTKKTSRFSPVAGRLIKTSAAAQTGIGRFVKILVTFLALVRHRTMPGRAPYVTQTVAVGIVRFKF